jgi:hypothetical protein
MLLITISKIFIDKNFLFKSKILTCESTYNKQEKHYFTTTPILLTMAVAFEILDLAFLFGVISLILWILYLAGVWALGSIAHIFGVIALVLFVIWIAVRLLGVGRGTRGGLFRRNREIV